MADLIGSNDMYPSQVVQVFIFHPTKTLVSRWFGYKQAARCTQCINLIALFTVLTFSLLWQLAHKTVITIFFSPVHFAFSRIMLRVRVQQTTPFDDHLR